MRLDVVSDSFAGERGDYLAPLILVRPDGFVAWCGDGSGNAGEPETILDRAIGA